MAEPKRGFVAQVMKGGKITIPVEVRKLLDIETGEMVDVEVRKAKK